MKRNLLIALALLLVFCWSPARDRRLENTSGLFEVKIGLKSGFINREGKIAIRPQFDEVGYFSEGLCAARVLRLWGYIGPSGEWVINPRFEGAGPFTEGLAPVTMRGLWGYADVRGNLTISPRFEAAGEYFEGLARVRFNGRWGFINGKGDRVILPQYEDARDFFEGLAAVKLGGKWGFIDKSGKLAVPFRFDEAQGFQEGLALVSRGRVLTFIDRTGKILFPAPPFIEAMSFFEGLASARSRSTGRYGYIDKTGTFVVLPHFEQALPFWEGLAAVSVNGRFGYIDKAGQVVIEHQFDMADCFINGVALVSVRGREGYIDKQGQFIWKPGQMISTPSRVPVKKAADTGPSLEEADETETYIRYDMAGLSEIVIQGYTLTYTRSEYKGQTPYADGSPSDYVFFTDTCPVSEEELAALTKVFQDNRFFDLKDTYGDLEPGERYYGITLTLKLDGREKSVLFKSNPRVTPPPEFAAIEKALEDLVKKKFAKS